MKRILLPGLLWAVAAAPGWAQDDFELASALAERGWWDVSEELFTRIAQNGSLSAETKAEGRYGLARLNIQMAERAENPEEKNKLFDKAIKGVEQFLKDFPAHPRRGEALSDVGYLHQSRGKFLMNAAKADPSKAEEAEKSFAAAEKLFLDLIGQLKKNEKKLPENDKDQKAINEYQAWEEKMMFAKYNYGTALFAHAEIYRDMQAKHPEMKKLLEAMVKFFNDEFMWQYETYLLAFDASIYMGRGFQMLAETAEKEKAEDYWKQAFMNVGRAKSLLSDKASKGNEAIRDIAARAILYEMKARLSYGDSKRGQAGLREFATAARLAEDFFKAFPQARLEEMGRALQLEQARVYCKSGQVNKGIDLLKQLAKQYKDSWVENIAVDIMGEYGADQSPALAVDAANNFFGRGPAFLYKAVQKYRKALLAIKRPEDQKYAPECWYQIGQSYYYLDRYYEAVAALSQFEKPPLGGTEYASKAALLKLQSLAKIAKMSKDKADEKALEDFRTYVTKTYPKEAGAQLLRQAAVDAEMKQQWADAVQKWEQIAKPDSPIYEEALFSIGMDSYYQGNQLFEQARAQKAAAEKEKLQNQGLEAWKKGLEYARKHVELVDKMAAKDGRVAKNAVGSVGFAMRMMLSDRINQTDQALAFSEDVDKKYPGVDAKLVIGIMSLRIDAKLKKGQAEEAESDLKALKAKYEKEQVGLDHYSRALSMIANALTEQAARLKDKDPEQYDVLGVKAADYFYEYYLLNSDKVGKNTDQMEGMAQMLFIAAEQRMKKAEQKSDKDLMEEAKKIYARSRDLYSEILLQREAGWLKADKRDEIRAVKARITRCLLMTGQFQKAIEMYKEVTQADPQMRDGSSWEELSDCYVEQARTLPQGAQKTALLKQADDVYAQLAAMLMQQNLYNEHTWRLLYKHAAILFEIDPDKLHSLFTAMKVRGYAPKWDNDDKGVSRWGFQPKFEELKARLEQKLPGKK